jgi:hypothetical protein
MAPTPRRPRAVDTARPVCPHTGASSSSSVAPVDPVETIFNDLIALMNKEGETLAGAANQIKTQIIDQFASLSATDVITRFLAIIADTILQTAENAITMMLDVIAQLLTGMMDILTATVDIPVLSWLYKQLTQENLSFINLPPPASVRSLEVSHSHLSRTYKGSRRDCCTRRRSRQ